MRNRTNRQRRKFLQQLGVIGGGSTLLATQTKLQLIDSVLAADYSRIQDHKSLVCIFLSGGNDAFNMFVPYQTTEYQHYRNIRQTLAIPRNQLLPVNGGIDYAFHPSMGAARNIYNQGHLALISNVGTLYEPLTQQQYLAFKSGDKNIRVPPDLFSHSQQQEIWQTNRSREATSIHPGWGGLIADLLDNANSNPNIPPTISLTSNNNLWQSGNRTQPFSVSSNGIKDFNYLTGALSSNRERSRTNSWNSILQLNRNHVLEQESARSFRIARRRITELQGVLLNAPQIQTQYPNRNDLAESLQMIARLISVRETLGLKRQIFFVRHGSWDTHSNQISKHAALLTTLNDALNAFYQTTLELGVSNTVTTFTASEFGRTATSNGDGTDHGWGGHHLVMGGAVRGGSVHGILPDITPESIDDASDAGRMIPTIAVDQYGATLAKWMGIADNDLSVIFPNLDRFSTRDLGFMSL